MVWRDMVSGSPIAKVANHLCSLGLISKEPAVGFMQDTSCVLPMFFCVSLDKSYTCSYSRCCLSRAMALCVSYGSTSGKLISSMKYTSLA